MKKAIWISFDFGMKGDYEGLYKWLDENGAEERGYGLALIKNIDFPKKCIPDTKQDLAFKKYIRKEISKTTEIGKSDRIYMIWKSIENSKLRGGFIFGRSKAAPWIGYADTDEGITDFDLED